MSFTPALMLPIGAQQSVLYKSKCVGMTMDEKTSCVTITAHKGDGIEAACAITGIMESADVLLGRGKEYSVVWDLRDSPTPGFRDTMRLAKWGLSKKGELEALTTKMGVIVPEGPVASVTGSMLAAFSGVPTLVSASAQEVQEFM